MVSGSLPSCIGCAALGERCFAAMSAAYRCGLGSSRCWTARVQTLASNCPKWHLNSGREPPGADRVLTMDTQGCLRLPGRIESNSTAGKTSETARRNFTVGWVICRVALQTRIICDACAAASRTPSSQVRADHCSRAASPSPKHQRAIRKPHSGTTQIK